MNALLPHSVVGTFRRFGSAGPVYEVVGFGDSDPAGEQLMRIHVFDSGEDANYKLKDVLDDPVAN